MRVSNLGNIRVPFGPDDVYIRRSPHVCVYDPVIGPPVLRTPHQVVYEPEAGDVRYPGNLNRKFLQDGRTVPMGALGSAFGSISTDGETDLLTALQTLDAQYIALQQAAGRIIATYKSIGRPIPCEVRGKHNSAVHAYLKWGMDLFAQAEKKGVTFNQIVRDQSGNPVMDASGKPKFYAKLNQPLRPGTFIVSDCAAGTSPGTAVAGAFGFVPLIIGGLIVLGLGGILTAGAVAAIRIYVQRDSLNFVNSVTAANNALMDCLDRAKARGETGATAEQACRAAADALDRTKPPSQGIGVLGWIGIAATVTAIGAGTYWWLKKRRVAQPR